MCLVSDAWNSAAGRVFLYPVFAGAWTGLAVMPASTCISASQPWPPVRKAAGPDGFGWPNVTRGGDALWYAFTIPEGSETFGARAVRSRTGLGSRSLGPTIKNAAIAPPPCRGGKGCLTGISSVSRWRIEACHGGLGRPRKRRHHQCPVFSMLAHGSAGGSASPACRSSMDTLSGERTNAICPSLGGRLMTTPLFRRCSHVS